MTDSFGSLLAATSSASDWLRDETDTGRGARFAAIDELVAAVAAVSFAGNAPVQLTAAGSPAPVTLRHIPASVRATVTEVFDLDAQQAKGAWWLPESAVLKAGLVNLPAYYMAAPQWAMNTAATDAGRVGFTGCPDALACWALLIPFADTLLAPLSLRGPDTGAHTPDQRDAEWAAVDTAYAQLGLANDAVLAAVATMRPGHGWSRLGRAEQTAAKVALIDALRDAINPSTVRRWRATALRPLLERFYAKAKKGQPVASAVLTKALQPVLAASFGGSWLALLDYLDEQPTTGEEIPTALPEARLYVQASAKVEQVAAEQNLPVSAVAQLMASYLGSDEVRSPVERRVEVLRRVWTVIDALHAEQAPGMPPLTELLFAGWLPPRDTVPFTTPVAEHCPDSTGRRNTGCSKRE